MYELSKFLKMSKNFPKGMKKRYKFLSTGGQFQKPRILFLLNIFYFTPIVYATYSILSRKYSTYYKQYSTIDEIEILWDS